MAVRGEGAGYGCGVPRRRDIEGPPCSYVQGGWLEGEPFGPVAVVYAQELARRLARAVEGRSLREVARSAGVDHTTVAGVLSGGRWPDLVTVAKLEQALGVRLWPDLVDG